MPRGESTLEWEFALRLAALRWLDGRDGELVRHSELATFTFQGQRVALMDRQRGIRKPAGMTAALSFRTTYTRPGAVPPYADAAGPDGLLRYKYRGDNPQHPENVALRTAQQRADPLIWFVGVAEGMYLPRYPVWLISDEPNRLQFVVALDEGQRHQPVSFDIPVEEAERRYAERLTRQRLHQPTFQARVLEAYERRCSMCWSVEVPAAPTA